MTRAIPLAALALGVLPAQTVNPGATAVPNRIVASVASTPSGQSETLLANFTPAPVSYLNDRLPGWIRLSAAERLRLESVQGQDYVPGNDDVYLLLRFRFDVTLRPASWMRVYSELQDARVVSQSPPVRPPNQNTWDLRQAYIELGQGEDARFRIRVGRQEVNFGAGRLIGRSDWRNAGRTFDAALASLREGRYRLTAFSLSVVVPLAEGLSHHTSGNAIHGLYGGIDNLIPHSVLEPTVMWRVAPGYRTDSGSPAKISEMTYGVRLAGMVTSAVDYSAEAAAQSGRIATDTTSGWTVSLVGGYMADIPGPPGSSLTICMLQVMPIRAMATAVPGISFIRRTTIATGWRTRLGGRTSKAFVPAFVSSLCAIAPSLRQLPTGGWRRPKMRSTTHRVLRWLRIRRGAPVRISALSSTVRSRSGSAGSWKWSEASHTSSRGDFYGAQVPGGRTRTHISA